jgi:hypothetical protein
VKQCHPTQLTIFEPDDNHTDRKAHASAIQEKDLSPLY